MFRCENCGSGYSMQAASSWEACPKCLAREHVKVPLTFELGWRGAAAAGKRFERPVSGLKGRERRSEASVP
jgi:hypothetical protein